MSERLQKRLRLTPVEHKRSGRGRPATRRRPQDAPRRKKVDRRATRGPRPSDVGLVKILTSAQVDAGVTHEAAGVILFKHIFRIAPQALPLFSFGRVAGAEVNDALFEQEDLKAHATKVVATVATAVGMLTKLDELVPILTSLGTKHVGYGVVPEHYAVVGEALIATLGDALGDAFDAETKAAWVAVYGIVQKTMIGDNYN